jgi:hypothetical protein
MATVNLQATIREVYGSIPDGIYLGRGRFQCDILPFRARKLEAQENYRFSHDITKMGYVGYHFHHLLLDYDLFDTLTFRIASAAVYILTF